MFILYFIPFLIGSVILFAFLRQFSTSFSAKGNKPLWYGGISSVLASGATFLLSFISQNLWLLFWIMAGVYLVFGMIHFWFVHKKYFSERRESKDKMLVAEILFSLSIITFSVAAFAVLQYFLKDKSFLYYPLLMSMLFFFVPLLVYHTFNAAYEIPSPVYQTWQYPVDQAIEVPDEKENEQLFVIGFEIAKNYTDESRTYFRSRAPADMVLGELFYHFLNDYNEMQSETPIEFVTRDGELYSWYFRTKPKWYAISNILDPYRTVNQNRIKENTVVICERAAM